MTYVGWGRPDFYFDPPATRQDRAEAWAWNQAQDRARRDFPAVRPVLPPDDARCAACAMPMTGRDALVRRCTHCGRSAAESTTLLARMAA